MVPYQRPNRKKDIPLAFMYLILYGLSPQYLDHPILVAKISLYGVDLFTHTRNDIIISFINLMAPIDIDRDYEGHV